MTTQAELRAAIVASGVPRFTVVQNNATNDGTGPKTVAAESVAVNDGDWHFLFGSFDGTTVTMKVDDRPGVSVDSALTNQLQDFSGTTARGITIGGDSYSSGSGYGRYSNAFVCNYAATEEDALSVYRAARLGPLTEQAWG